MHAFKPQTGQLCHSRTVGYETHLSNQSSILFKFLSKMLESRRLQTGAAPQKSESFIYGLFIPGFIAQTPKCGVACDGRE